MARIGVSIIETAGILNEGFEEFEKVLLFYGVGLIKHIPYNGKLIRVKILPQKILPQSTLKIKGKRE